MIFTFQPTWHGYVRMQSESVSGYIFLKPLLPQLKIQTMHHYMNIFPFFPFLKDLYVQ